jgi:hypothetical protein
MPILDKGVDPRIHLAYILADQTPAATTQGELEQLRCIRRELYALKAQLSLHDPKTVLITGEVLQTLLNLV